MGKITFSGLAVFLAGALAGAVLAGSYQGTAVADDLAFGEEEAAIRAIKKAAPAVVSIEVFDYENTVRPDPESGGQKTAREKRSKGRGTGFLITGDGFIVTNKHVLAIAGEKSGEYRVTLNTGKEYYAQFIGLDPAKDLAVLKIFDKDLPYIELGDSRELEAGQTVIAIGNSLGRYQNSATKGIVSGLGRFLAVSDSQTGARQALDNVIQCDAEINPGNSGGPLLNLRGQAVGMNVAIDEGGSAIGFAIPINDAKPVIRSIRESGRIARPRLGVYYQMLDPAIAEKNRLPRSTGAWVHADGDIAAASLVLPGSAAEKAGILPGDIIFEINAIIVDGKDTLAEIVQNYRPGDRIGLKIQRGGKVIIRELVLDEF